MANRIRCDAKESVVEHARVSKQNEAPEAFV